jgi:inner membrane protein
MPPGRESFRIRLRATARFGDDCSDRRGGSRFPGRADADDMDTLTHALSGALLARAGFARKPLPGEPTTAQRMLVGALACGFPDIDFIASFISPLTYLVNHRGITHSLVALPLWAALIAWLAAKALHPQRGMRAFIGVAAMGVGLHILGDLITTFGTILFSPVSDARFAWGTTFIIDLWFSGIIIAGLAASLIWRSSRKPALAACIALTAYVLFQALMKHEAAGIGREYARAQGLTQKGVSVSALPRAVSPFNWTVVVSTPDAQHFANINLVQSGMPPEAKPDDGFFARMRSSFYPRAMARWQLSPRFGFTPADQKLAREAWEQPDFAFYRWFADYPALFLIDRQPGATCVWFQDLRFLNVGVGYTPFRQGMCREQDSPWQRFELLTEGRRVRFD